jgi:hypothetical protein
MQRDRYWSMLQRASQDFVQSLDTQYLVQRHDLFNRYLRQHYGLQIETIDGQITSDYAVVDEKKYLLFLLKYGQ